MTIPGLFLVLIHRTANKTLTNSPNKNASFNAKPHKDSRFEINHNIQTAPKRDGTRCTFQGKQFFNFKNIFVCFQKHARVNSSRWISLIEQPSNWDIFQITNIFILIGLAGCEVIHLFNKDTLSIYLTQRILGKPTYCNRLQGILHTQE